MSHLYLECVCVCRLNTLDVPEPGGTGTLNKAGSVSQLFGDHMRRGESVLRTCFALNKLVPQADQVLHVTSNRYSRVSKSVNLDTQDFFFGHHPF
jgi:hypothetical protein